MTGDKDETNNESVRITGSEVHGMVAGRDVDITKIIEDRGPEELIQLLNHRAEKIEDELESHYSHAPAQEYLDEFKKLHEKHIEALENGEYVLAHEILRDIHRLSFKLEKENFWSKDEGGAYELKEDAFERGPMVCGYVAGHIHGYSSLYPSVKDSIDSDSETPKSPYEIMFETS